MPETDERSPVELRESEARYRRAERGVSEGLWEWHLDSGEGFLSPRWCAMLGYEPDELRPHIDTVLDLIHPDDRNKALAAVERHERLGHPYDVELRMRHKDGAYRWFRSRAQISYESGCKRLTGAILDVSEHKRAELRLLEAHRLAGLGAWERDLINDTIWWSPQQYLLNGIEPDTPVSHASFLELLHPDDRDRFAAAYQQVFERGSIELEFRIVRPDGEVRHMHGVATLTRDAGGNPIRMAGTNQDITARVEANEALRRSLAEKDTLLREIHHRVKNNLSIVASLLYFQTNKLSSPKDREALIELRQRILAMSLVHEQLYRDSDVSRVDFGSYVRRLTEELRRSSGKLGTPSITVEADELELPIEFALPAGQLLCELITNAIKYADPREYPTAEVRVVVRSLAGELCLEVQDDGVGLPEGFDPHATTSFGWQLVRLLVRQLSGSVELIPGAGAHVRITAPLPA